MRRSVLWKFITAYMLFAILGFLTINFTTSKQTYQQLLEDNVNTLYKAATAISADIAESGISSINDIRDSDSYIEHFNNTLSCQIWVSDVEGNIYHSSSDDGLPSSIPKFNLSYFGNHTFEVGRFFKMFSAPVLTVYYPIQVDDVTIGYVFIHRATSHILYDTIKITNIFYITYFIIMFFSLILLGTYVIYVYVPIKSIRHATLEYANGNFGYNKLKIYTNDEIGDVAASLTYMAHQLNDAEEYQKKFISNISHDFRSPLTSIKGYAEAIIDGTIPHETQDKYLNIIISEAARLERLTSGLITLNNWGAKKPGLIMEDFDLETIIKTTVASFEGTSDKKSIQFDFDWNEKNHYVVADKDKIEQVLYNLVDNAIKFSPNNSTITIKVYTKGDKIFCSVRDCGIGIPKSEINKIWDRFYKTDISRGRDKTGSGIGLAIVREIISAHSQNIDVISTEGVGTEFIFSLARAKNRKK